ncbi:hypothetical protein GCM10027034_37380 [Ramlibacter solisilvae]|uniref:Uncharacterized protein n=1 Tax=Ramlibacter tataouinensis TaxID=94132 RepID=A0A127JUJ4_9BURK|nr:hypothetical protein UC35_13305 [Ramlibacter tataouinensis]
MDQIDFQLRCNLRDLFLEDAKQLPLTVAQRSDALSLAREFIGVDLPGHLVARRIARAFPISDIEAATLLYQGAWRRELRVDLYRPFLMTKPLRPEVTDVFAKFSDWFAR